MIKSKEGEIEIRGKVEEILAELATVVGTLKEDGILTKPIYELMWKMAGSKKSTTIDIEELRRQFNDTM